jgi:hypothetical protein
MSFLQFSAKAQKMMAFVETVAERFSYETQFVRRRSKMTGSLFLKTLLLGWLKNPQAGLMLLCQRAQEFGVTISPQGLAERFNAQAVTYLKQLFEHSLTTFHSKQPLPLPLLQQFSAILLTDSTQVELPPALAQTWKGAGGCASPAALKMHLTFEYLRGDLQAVALTAGSRPDTHQSLTYPPGSLSLFDLGYFALARFKQIAQQHAFFLTRLRPNTLLFATPDASTAVDLEALCARLPADVCEFWLFLGDRERIPVRLVLSRCPQQVVDSRRRTAYANAKRKGRQPSQKYLALLQWTFFITNVPDTMLSALQVTQLYRIRWQIELLFKLCKSQLHLDAVQGCGEHRILCQLYARMILLVLLCDGVAAFRFGPQGELSLVKAFQLFSDYADRLIACLRGSPHALTRLLMTMKDDFLRLARKNRRNKSPSTLALLA